MKLVFRFGKKVEQGARSGNWTDRNTIVRWDPQRTFRPSCTESSIGFRCYRGIK